MARNVSIAACQFLLRPVESFDEFAEHVRSLLDEAEGVDIILFPELFTLELFTTFPHWQTAPLSEVTRIDQYTGSYRELFEGEAKRRGQWILAGSHLTKEGGRYLNLSHLFGPKGEIHLHAKTHIFPEEASWSTAEGDTMEAIDLPFARVGINICYETEIPECAASLTQQGVEIILCPSFTMSEHGFWRVRHCAQARCIENQVYYAHCCSGGRPGMPLPNGWARSSILSPCDAPWNVDGTIAQAEPNREMVIRGEVEIDSLHENRERGAGLTYRDRRRRAHLYARWPSHLDAKGAPGPEAR